MVAGFCIEPITLIALLVFAVMGLLIAFFVNRFYSRLAYRPQPGQWMVTFKEFLSVPFVL